MGTCLWSIFKTSIWVAKHYKACWGPGLIAPWYQARSMSTWPALQDVKMRLLSYDMVVCWLCASMQWGSGLAMLRLGEAWGIIPFPGVDVGINSCNYCNEWLTFVGGNHPSFNKLHLQWHAHLSSWAWAHLRLSNGLLHGYSMWGWGWGVPLQITLCITTMVPPQGGELWVCGCWVEAGVTGPDCGGGNGCCRGFNYLPVIWTIIAYYREYKVQIIHMIITSILVR